MLFPLTMKKTIWLILFGFIVFFILKSPVEAAEAIRAILRALNDWFIEGARGFSEFLRALF